MIQLQSLSLQRGNKPLLENASVTVFPGQTWGIVGANGSGKTSLFKLLLGELQEDSGSCQYPSAWELAHMAQETEASNQSARDFIVDGDSHYRTLEMKIESGNYHGEALAQLYQEMETIDGYTIQPRAERLLRGLGFSDEDSDKPVKAFSGGWRIRLNLARALMCRSDLLLLDEPTNHLDLDATLWLEQWLRHYPGTLLIISHDREFLDNLVEGIVHFEDLKLHSYKGNYSAFEIQRAERIAQQAAAYQKQQERIDQIENFVRRFRAKATKAKQAQSRLKELERMEKISPAHVESPFQFSFPQAERIPESLVSLDELAIGYETPLATNISINVLASSRIGLLGHNGAGKSTLIKTLAGEMQPVGGNIVGNAHLKIGYFAQHQLEQLDLNASCALHIQRLSAQTSEQEIRNFLGGFGFQGDRAFESIRHFSGGEKARLAIALLAWQKPNLLLLDEPTNHLDLEVRHALTLALQAFEGGLIIVSHDRHLLRCTVDQFFLVDKGSVNEFDGTLEDYHHWLLESASENDALTPEKNNAGKALDKKELRQQEAAIRKQLAPYSKKINLLEIEIARLTESLSKLEEELANPELYSGDTAALEPLLKKQAQVKSSLEEKELAWMEASEEKESLEAEIRNPSRSAPC